MPPDLDTTLIAFAVVASGVIGWLVHHSEPAAPLDEWSIRRELEFKTYVERAIYKARHGAANAPPWAVQLVAIWDERTRR